MSGEVRVVRGVPLRIRPNRTDTSWAEAYIVTAAAPLKASAAKPKRFLGPWMAIGRLVEDPFRRGRWQINYEGEVELSAEVEPPQSFDDSLVLLAEAWRRSLEPIACPSLPTLAGAGGEESV